MGHGGARGAAVMVVVGATDADRAFFAAHSGIDWKVIFPLLGIVLILAVHPLRPDRHCQHGGHRRALCVAAILRPGGIVMRAQLAQRAAAGAPR